MQSSLQSKAKPLHVAIIMDGNGRWATARGLPRPAGHRAGADAVRRVIEASPGLGISTLTLFAFSSDNWRRPRTEVDALMGLLRRFLEAETDRCVEKDVRVTILGRRDRLATALGRGMRRAERATARGERLHLRIAVDYSSRETIARAALRWARARHPSLELFGRMIAQADDDAPIAPEVDLLIRTGGEQRLSDFLLWECAYAELLFVPRMWPDFAASDLADAVTEFHRRDRRFGAVARATNQPASACILVPEGP